MRYELPEVIRRLRGTGITQIVATYSGGGDEGHVDKVSLVVEEGSEIDADAVFLSAALGSSLSDLGDHLVDKYATGDYSNDDGGYGTVTLDILAGTVENDQYYYTQESYRDENNSGTQQLVEPAEGHEAACEVGEAVELE